MADSKYSSIFQSIDEKQDDFVETLREAVSIPSVSAEEDRRPDCVRMVKWIQQKMEDLNIETELVNPGTEKLANGNTIDLPPILLGTLGKDDEKKTLLVYGHLDVQPANKEDGWATDPFVLEEKDEKLFGRGSSDDKGPVLAWLNAIKVLQQLNIAIPVNIKFCFEAMEESSSKGLEETLKNRKHDFLSDISFSCISDNYWLGTNKPCLTYGLRGISYFMVQVTCARQDLHSGLYGGVIQEAMTDLIWILGKLVSSTGEILIPGLDKCVDAVDEEELELYRNLDFDVDTYKKESGLRGVLNENKVELLMNRWRFPSLSIHGIQGAFSGEGAKTVIPSKVTGKFSIRTVPSMTPDTVEPLVEAYLNDLWSERGSKNEMKVSHVEGGKPWIANPKDNNFQAGARAIRQVFGVDPDYTREGGSIPIALTIQEVTGSSVILLPIGSSNDMAHSQNEKIDRHNYIQGTKVLAAYLMELAES